MANIHPDRSWGEESPITDESAWLNRRRFLQALGAGGLAAGGLAAGARSLIERADAEEAKKLASKLAALKAKPNPAFKVGERKQTAELVASRYNNFYEFTTDKGEVWKAARDFKLDPYALEVGGLVDKPGKLTLETVEKLGLEERVYRFRCVEAWSMTVPWIGVPLAKVLDHVGVKSKAKYVSFVSFLDPKQAPKQRSSKYYKWPYYEALRVDEARNALTLLATGIYGKRLPPQMGSPLRVVVPWKYGFKSAKSVVKIVLTAKRPPTFWNDAAPKEYSWLSNVEPDVAHPRWSQRYEKHLLTAGALGPRYTRIKTKRFNGYAE